MSCVLRISGEDLDTQALLAAIGLVPYRVWRRGEPRFSGKPEGRLSTTSGMTFVASDADSRDFDTQVSEATAFLELHRGWLRCIRGFPGVEHYILDFGIELRDALIHSDLLNPPFIQAAAAAGVTVELSHYPHQPEDANA